jgi:hypothetical protein
MNGIWIRTQDRQGLYLIEDIHVTNTGVISDCYELANYESKERALKVIEDIQEYIMSGLDVFQMPRE